MQQMQPSAMIHLIRALSRNSKSDGLTLNAIFHQSHVTYTTRFRDLFVRRWNKLLTTWSSFLGHATGKMKMQGKTIVSTYQHHRTLRHNSVRLVQLTGVTARKWIQLEWIEQQDVVFCLLKKRSELNDILIIESTETLNWASKNLESFVFLSVRKMSIQRTYSP